jgi:RNA polymerase sigma-70 factor (ECF subfamily)
VYGICLRILREPADAEEVALDVYTQAWQSARHFDPARGNVTAWLAILARSRAIDRLRLRSRHDVCDGLDTAPELPARGLDPEQRTMQNAGQQRVRQALRQLPARQRQLLELAFFYGFTHSELARKLGQPLGTVKTRLRSALSSLRLALNNSCCSSVY